MSPTDSSMTPERWREVERILDAALDRPPGEWRAFLERACADSPGLRGEVESLLRRYPEVEGFLREPAAEVEPAPGRGGGPEPGASGAEMEGRRIGPYRIVREIARGGMGHVFLAERADGQFERRVALKVLPTALAADESTRRFRAERQILAGLEHASIARLLDGGVTDGGRPYLVMEYVEGEPIDRYCDGRRLPVRERLRLFLEVAGAVQHAHRSLVVHRDLKPSNIHVTGDGRVKLLDFGIAKLLAPAAGDATVPRTRTGRRWMTPEYAAPEQIEGESPTTATDIYQLGVLLFQLLSGRRPFEADGESLHRLERAILETEPERPSGAAGRAEALRRTLRGDLDAIVLKALRKDPGDRYPSVQAMAADVERYLDGRPVRARRGTVAYRAGKFLRRHRWSVSAAAAFVLLLAGYAATVTVQSERVGAALAEARVETEKAEQVSAFLVDLFEASDPDEARGEEVTARQLLGRGVERAEELEGQPEVRARMMEVMGLTYQRLGAYEEAGPLFERSLSLRREVFGPEHEQVASSLNYLGALHKMRGEYEAAEPLLRRALAMRRGLLGDEHEDVAVTLDELARLYEDLGEYERAEALYREALAMRRRLLGDGHRQTGTSLNDLGMLLLETGEGAEAEPLLRQAISVYRDALGENHPWVATAVGNLGLVLLDRGEPASAEPLFRRTLAMYRRLMGEDHPYVADALHGLASAIREQGRYGEADSLSREAVRRGRAALGDAHPRLSRFLVGRARIHLGLRRPDRAEPLLREALGIRREALPEDHWEIPVAKSLLGRSLAELGRHAEAEPLLRESHAALRERFGADDRRTTEAAGRLATFREARGVAERAVAEGATRPRP